MQRVDTLRRELRELEAELEDIYSMSEQAACECYNVDSKEEIIAIVEAEIAAAKDAIDNLESDDETERGLYHFAFPTEANFWIYKGY